MGKKQTENCFRKRSRQTVNKEVKNISWNSTVWYLERLYLETYRINLSSPIKTFSFMDIEEKENRIYVQEYMKYCLGITHLALSVIRTELNRILEFVIWLEETTDINLRDVSENEIKQYFQTIDSNRAGSFNVIVTAIYQFYEYMQVKNLIKEVPFNYKYYLKKEILHHDNRTVDMEMMRHIHGVMLRLKQLRQL